MFHSVTTCRIGWHSILLSVQPIRFHQWWFWKQCSKGKPGDSEKVTWTERWMECCSIQHTVTEWNEWLTFCSANQVSSLWFWKQCSKGKPGDSEKVIWTERWMECCSILHTVTEWNEWLTFCSANQVSSLWFWKPCSKGKNSGILKRSPEQKVVRSVVRPYMLWQNGTNDRSNFN